MSIAVKDLILKYKSGDSFQTIVDIPEWKMEKGRQAVIHGPSGSGKTTLLHTVAGLIKPTSGTVEVCGSKISDMNEIQRDRFRARHIGYIFQNFNLLQGYTALENIMLGMSFSQIADKSFNKTARSLLSQIGLEHRIHHYPSALSIGEQQRVAIARAIAKEPDVILADEPTGSLDAKNTEEIINLLIGVCSERECSLIVVSHEKEVIDSFESKIAFEKINRAYKNNGKEVKNEASVHNI